MNPETQDFLIMKLRTLARMRGAKPADIQRNIAAIEAQLFPATLGAQYLPEPDFPGTPLGPRS